MSRIKNNFFAKLRNPLWNRRNIEMYTAPQTVDNRKSRREEWPARFLESRIEALQLKQQFDHGNTQVK